MAPGVWVHVLVAIAVCAHAFQLDYVAPSVLAPRVSSTVRLATQYFPYRRCGSASVEVVAASGTATPCVIASCFPSYLLIKVPQLSEAGEYQITVVADETEILHAAFRVADGAPALFAASPDVLVIPPVPKGPFIESARISLTVLRSTFPTDDYAATVRFVPAGEPASPEAVIACKDTAFDDIPGSPELIAVSCKPTFPSDGFEPADRDAFLLTALLTVGAQTHSLESAALAVKAVTIARVEPASSALYASTLEPRTLTLSLGPGSYGGAAPLCVRITPAGGGAITVDDAAAVYAPDFISVTYTSKDAAPGAAALDVGVFDSAGACLPALRFPAALTVTTDAPPPLQRVLAVYPPEFDPRALAERPVFTVHLEGSLPAAVSIAVGSAAAKIVESSAAGFTARFTAPASAGQAFVSLVVRDAATGAVLAHAPTALQLVHPRLLAIVDAQPPVLVGVAGAGQTWHDVDFRGSNLLQTAQAIVSHCGLSLYVDAISTAAPRSLWLLSLRFALKLTPGHPVLFQFLSLSTTRTGVRAADASDVILTWEIPVIDGTLQSLTPSWVVFAPGAEASFTAQFATLPPFPFALLFGSFAPSQQNFVTASGALVVSQVKLSDINPGSVPVTLTVRDLYDPEAEWPALVTGMLFRLHMDIIVFMNFPRITNVTVSRAVSTIAPQGILLLTTFLDGDNRDQFSVKIGPYSAYIRSQGPFYFFLDLLDADAPFSAQKHDVAIFYRDDQVAAHPDSFEFFTPSDGSPTGQSMSPKWRFTDNNMHEFTVFGERLRAVDHVVLVPTKLGQDHITTDRVSLSADGRSLKFVVTVQIADAYLVFVHNLAGQFEVGSFVAVDPPMILSVTPNGTIPLGPDGQTPLMRMLFSDSTALMQVPVQYYAVFESNGEEQLNLTISHAPWSLQGVDLRLSVTPGTTVPSGDYRLCVRSLIASDITSTEREIAGENAIFTAGESRAVPIVDGVHPSNFHVAVNQAERTNARTIYLALKHADGNLPPAENLVASIGQYSASVLYVGSNFIVLDLPSQHLEMPNYDIFILNSLTTRTVVSTFRALSMFGHETDPVQLYGLSSPRMYLSDRTGPIVVSLTGHSGMDTITAVVIHSALCETVAVTPEVYTCAIDPAHVYSWEVFTLVEVFAEAQRTALATLEAEFIPLVTAQIDSVDYIDRNTVHVVMSYSCARDLSSVPLAPRLAGVTAIFSKWVVSGTTMSFTAHRVSGHRDTFVELYDVAASQNVAQALTFVAFPEARVFFKADSACPTWAIALAVVGGAAALLTAAAFGRALWLKHNRDIGDDKDEYEYDDEPGVSRAAYSSIDADQVHYELKLR